MIRERVSLPLNFRCHDVLAFHSRDTRELAERVGATTFQKGLTWRGRPARLSIGFDRSHELLDELKNTYKFQTSQGPDAHRIQTPVLGIHKLPDNRDSQHTHRPQARPAGGCFAHAVVELAVDGSSSAAGDLMERKELQAMAVRMMGLSQPVEDFEAAHREHPQIGCLLKARPGLRVPAAATPFEALNWAIIGQQISVHAAIAVRRRLIQAAGTTHSSGLLCYPDASRLVDMSEAELRQAGLSRSKAQTLASLSRRVEAGELPLDGWMSTATADEVRRQLLEIRGIGPWTVDYALLRGFGWVDGSLHGDVAVRRKLQLLLGQSEQVSQSQAQHWLEEFSPWRSLVAAHLWSLST